MPYSMVGTPALGYDLARLRHGEQAAVVLRTALRCTPGQLRRLALRSTGQLEPPAGTAMPMVSALAGDAADGADGADGAARLRLLETATLGSSQALDRFLRSEVLEWAWREPGVVAPRVVAAAADVLCEAASPAFVDDAPPAWRRRVVAPFLGANLPRVDDGVPTGHAGVDELLDEVRGADARTRRAWREALDEARPWTTEWAPAMHQATWALHLTDRLRLAADAQLAAVLAFRAGGFTAQDASHGVWNALSGTVHARLADDVLGTDDLQRLTRVHRRVSGCV